jgi:aminoglycoside/choline kinase family phosphotransferase
MTTQIWQEFCKTANIQTVKFEMLHQGLSFRTYQRVWDAEGNTYVLMCVPTDKPLEDGQSAVDGVIRPFLDTAAYLTKTGVRVPEILKVDESLGLVLLEDLGEQTFYDAFNGIGADMAWYEQTVSVLTLLAKASPMKNLPRYDMPLATVRGDYFLDDYLPAVRGGMPSSSREYDELRDILGDLYKTLAAMPWTMSLWDFHSPNLMISGDTPSIQNVGVLDFQDAKMVPLGYDLAAMAYDARYLITAPQRETMIAQFVRENTQFEEKQIRDAVVILSALRNLGILGRFARGAYRDGKTEFLAKMPLIWNYLDDAFDACEELAPLKQFLNDAMPNERMLKAS